MGTLVPQVAVDAVTFLTGRGISKDAAVGIVSVLYAGESGLNPGSQGKQSTETPGALNPSGAYGIASWNGPRQTALATFAKVKNLPVDQVNTQLLFVLTECANSYPKVWDAIKGPTTYQNFIPIFVEDYEVPANPSAEIVRAQAFAATLYPAIPSPAPAPAPAPPPTPTPAPAPKAPVVSPAPTPSQTPSATMDPIVAAMITQIVEAVISGLLKTALASAVPASSSTNTATPIVNSGTSPLVPVANLEQIIAAIVPTILAQVPKL